MVRILGGQVVPSSNKRWMKETEDGCIVEFDAICNHGASAPILSWEEE